MQLVDTHAHLAHPFLINNSNKIIETAKNAGVGKIVSIGCTLEEAEKSLELAKRHDGVYATAGLYPFDTIDEAKISDDDKLKKIGKFAEHKKVVAIGECGLDFSEPGHNEVSRSKSKQITLFSKQIDLAIKLKKPIIIHSRNAVSETINVLEKAKQSKDFDAVWHCFTENWDIAKKLIDLNIMISITGIVTYPSGNGLRDVVKQIPLDRIMLETDAPFLTPQDIRSQGIKLNRPEYVKMIAQKVADIREISIEKVAEITTRNANKFFNLNN